MWVVVELLRCGVAQSLSCCVAYLCIYVFVELRSCICVEWCRCGGLELCSCIVVEL